MKKIISIIGIASISLFAANITVKDVGAGITQFNETLNKKVISILSDDICLKNTIDTATAQICNTTILTANGSLSVYEANKFLNALEYNKKMNIWQQIKDNSCNLGNPKYPEYCNISIKNNSSYNENENNTNTYENENKYNTDMFGQNSNLSTTVTGVASGINTTIACPNISEMQASFNKQIQEIQKNAQNSLNSYQVQVNQKIGALNQALSFAKQNINPTMTSTVNSSINSMVGSDNGSMTPPPAPSLDSNGTASTTADCNQLATASVTASGKWFMLGAAISGCDVKTISNLGYVVYPYDSASNTYKTSGPINVGEGFWIRKK